LYYIAPEITEFLDIYCRGPAQSQLEYYMSVNANFTSYTLDGADLAYWGDLTTTSGQYYFAVQARNSFGSSGMSPAASADLPFSKPPDTPSAITDLSVEEWGYVWGHSNVYVKCNPVEPGMVYNIKVDGNPIYNDNSPVVVNGFLCLSIPKDSLSFSGPYPVEVTVKNKYTLNESGSFSTNLTLPQQPGITLAAVSLTPLPPITSRYVSLQHSPIGYSAQIKVFCGTVSGFTPSDTNQLPGLYNTSGDYIHVPRELFPIPGVYYIRVQAVGPYDTGGYSNEISLTVP
jgi:hypothetical protein